MARTKRPVTSFGSRAHKTVVVPSDAPPAMENSTAKGSRADESHASGSQLNSTASTSAPRVARKHARQVTPALRPLSSSGRRSDRSDSGDRRSRQIDGSVRKKRRKRRNKPGVVVMRDIRRLQQRTELLIPRLSFQRICREIAQRHARSGFGGGYFGGDGVRFQPGALVAIQEAAEYFMTTFFEDVGLAAIHGRRVTVMPKDVTLTLKLRGDPKYQSLESRGKRHA